MNLRNISISRTLRMNKIYFIQIITILVSLAIYLLSRYELIDLEQWMLSTVIAGVVFLIMRFILHEIHLSWVAITSLILVVLIDILVPLFQKQGFQYTFGDFLASLPVIFALGWIEILLEEGVEEVRDDLDK